jgi:serine/threonine protein kinase
VQVVSYKKILEIGQNIAHALRYLHEEVQPGIVVIHRDLKVLLHTA